ncbi:interferon-inducible GTPase 5-like [Gopherus flavomarginatus]|uniref:interferon-inducible GTPase 5-like n=1 Tax=Gopherus flavomarginatus TaxID=286002 RepID=UPI0021CBCEDB|nr:interferon-inducible GTPase 5-like [Gopherus flavomarginatus]
MRVSGLRLKPTVPLPGAAMAGKLSQEELEEMKAAFETGNITEVAAKLEELESLENQSLDIAITGEPGSGKSSFVNAIRGLGDEDEGAAKTGEVETTKYPEPYPHPLLPNVTVWDLPGIGTPSFQPHTYLKQVNFSCYDFFIIIASARFTSHHITLAQEIREMGKRFYYVRSKVDSDLHAGQTCRPSTYNEVQILQKIRNDCIKNLKDVGLQPNPPVRLKSVTFSSELQKISEAAVYQGNLTEAISSVQEFYCHTLNIAVTGESGSGKSSLINAMRGLRAGDEGAAETGMLDTMTEPKAYPDLVLPGVTLWDLPGVGTSYFPLNTYCKQLNLSRYDFFIIVGSQRFRSEHARLVHEIQRMGKRFYFVRSKADMDLDASRRQRPSSYNEERILQQIREDCRRGIAAEGVGHPQVFVVSSWEPTRYDFPLLRQTLQVELQHLKRQAFLRTLPDVASPIINQKKATLKGEIWKTALFSCLLAAVPVPGIAFLCTFFIFRRHLFRYYSSFGVDDRSLSALAPQVGKPMEKLTAMMTSLGTTPMMALKLLLDSVGTTVMVAEYSWKSFPLFGAMVSGGVSLVTTYFMLQKCLASVADDTQRVLSKALEAEGENTM